MTFAVVCPGQGAQHPEMLRRLGGHAAAGRVLREAADALGEDVCAWVEDRQAAFVNRIAQPLICVSQLAMWSVLREGLPAPRAFLGYSVGELACHGLADALDAASLATLARARAQAMDDANPDRPGGLVAVRGLARQAVAQLCGAHSAYIAIAAADDAFVVGGSLDALDSLEAQAAQHGAHATRLPVGVAAHTPLLDAAVERFRAALEASPLRAPVRPVIAGIDASWVTARESAIDVLSAQIAQTIEWTRCLDSLYERGCRVIIEIGPGRAMSVLVRDRFSDVEARSVEEFGNLDAARAWIVAKLTSRADVPHSWCLP